MRNDPPVDIISQFCLHFTTEHTKQHLEAWARRSARPIIYFLTHVKNSTVTVIVRKSHSRTGKPEKPTIGKIGTV